MKFPNALAVLEWVRVRKTRSDRWVLDLAGAAGWCWSYPQGVCVAIEVELDVIDRVWLQRVCLWFASLSTNVDDCLLLENGKLCLLRRHNHDLNTPEWESSLNQQLAVAAWLTKNGAPSEDVSAAEFGTWR